MGEGLVQYTSMLIFTGLFHCRLENLIKEYKQALKTSEEEVEQLQRRVSSQAPPPITMTTPSRFSTPGRSPPHSPNVDTPSKDVVLDPEPHGAEFEVGLLCFCYVCMYACMVRVSGNW